ncbi:hypothetical protein TNCV_4090671 [Trichonephila clavipes]|uniref:Uncharacterized protein n=1 Tax=Trichonephila clavipes TaxID=2585209 RepID=A0A8X6VI77_TRICX|nr:hypothetical protein TNCV_4090671 [Trichonephila clavipes]
MLQKTYLVEDLVHIKFFEAYVSLAEGIRREGGVSSSVIQVPRQWIKTSEFISNGTRVASECDANLIQSNKGRRILTSEVDLTHDNTRSHRVVGTQKFLAQFK